MNIRIGDKIEFISAQQLPKGPSTGSVIDRDGNQVQIKLNKHQEMQWFDVTKLKLKKARNDLQANRVLWIFT